MGSSSNILPSLVDRLEITIFFHSRENSRENGKVGKEISIVDFSRSRVLKTGSDIGRATADQ